LVYCHAGCSLDEVLARLGLQRKDLYARQDPANATPQERREYRDKVRQSGWRTAFDILVEEGLVMQIYSVDLHQERPCSRDNHIRFELAVERIQIAMETLK
jgi:hypothetical protein